MPQQAMKTLKRKSLRLLQEESRIEAARIEATALAGTSNPQSTPSSPSSSVASPQSMSEPSPPPPPPLHNRATSGSLSPPSAPLLQNAFATSTPTEDDPPAKKILSIRCSNEFVFSSTMNHHSGKLPLSRRAEELRIEGSLYPNIRAASDAYEPCDNTKEIVGELKRKMKEIKERRDVEDPGNEDPIPIEEECEVIIGAFGERKCKEVKGMGATYHKPAKISRGSRVVSTQEANERAQQAEERAREANDIAREAAEANERAQRSEERAWHVAEEHEKARLAAEERARHAMEENERARQAAEERARHAMEENERARQASDERFAQIQALYKAFEARMDGTG